MKRAVNHNFNGSAKTKDTVFGVLSIIFAVLFVPGIFIAGTIALWDSALRHIDDFRKLVYVISAIFGGIGCATFWLVAGIRALLRTGRAKKYADLFGVYPRMKVAFIIHNMKKPLESVSAELSILKRRGYFKRLMFDNDNKEVVFVEDVAPLPLSGEEAATYYKEQHCLPWFAILSALVHAACFMWLTFGSIWLLIPLAVVIVGAFIMTLTAFPAAIRLTEVPRKQPKLKKPGSTGDEIVDEALQEVFEHKKELHSLLSAIISPRIREPLKESLRVLDEITAYVSTHPEKVRNLRQFINYYLPTMVNFLKTYEELEKKPDKGENITTTLGEIEGVAAKMTKVFKQEYDDLFSDKAMDISAEVSVMQTIMKNNESADDNLK